ncbi:hypothetical protein Tco_1449585 [Tanacetum coccineum]
MSTSNTSKMHNDIMAVGSKESDGDNTEQEGKLIAKTYENTSTKVHALVDAKADAIHMILNRTVSTTTSTRMVKNEVNEIHGERIARKTNPLALITCYCQKKRQRDCHNTFTPPESDTEKDSDEEKDQGDKQIKKAMAFTSKTLKYIYKPTNNNLRTSSNTKNKNVDNFPRTDKRTRNDRKTGQYENHRAITIAENMDTIVTQVVLQTKIQRFNYKQFRHFAKECRPAKQVISAADDDTRPTYDTEPLEKVNSNITPTSSNMSNNEREVDQNANKHEDECVLLVCLIENLKLDVDENKKIHK